MTVSPSDPPALDRLREFIAALAASDDPVAGEWLDHIEALLHLKQCEYDLLPDR